jgi:hypothetical protein
LFHKEYQEYYLISNGFLDQTVLNTEELEEKIWQNASEWNSKTKLWKSIIPKCDKKTCFDRIKMMIPTQLKERKVKNRIEVKRIDTTNREQFEYGLTFQKNMLKLQRDALKKYPKPMFYFKDTIVHYIPPLTKANVKEFNKNPKFRKTFKIDETIKIWKTRRPNVRTTIENMKFYYQGFFIFISRAQLQKALGIISAKEANIRIKKCQDALEYHFKTMLIQNPKDNEAIRQFHELGNGLSGSIYDFGKFRI